MSKRKLLDSLDAFTRGYLECALWASIDEQPDGNGGPMLDENYDIDDCTVPCLKTAIAECRDFQEANRADLDSVVEREPGAHGHDFFLTRNRHGAGFWDRGYGAAGTRLTDAAHVYGDTSFYAYRGKIHQQ